MKTKLLFFILFVSSFVLFSCGRKAASKETIQTDAVRMVDVAAIKDTIKLELLDLMSEPKLVRLEQSNNPKLDPYENTSASGEAYVGKDYILAYSEGQFLLYDIEGKFIRSVAKQGQKQDEFSSLSTYLIDDKNFILYLFQMDRRKVLSYDMHTGRFVQELPNLLPTGFRQALSFNDSSFVVFSEPKPLEYKLYLLSISGEYRDSLELKLESDDDYLMQVGYGYKLGDRIKFIANHSQIYNITDFTLKPEWKLSCDTNNVVDIIGENSKYLFYLVQYITQKDIDTIRGRKMICHFSGKNPQVYALDKKTGRDYFMGGIYNNILEYK